MRTASSSASLRLVMARLVFLMLFLAGLWSALPAETMAQSRPGTTFQLEQNFPNPFTPGVSPTIFTYVLEREDRVRLTVYNLLAQEVVVLVDEDQRAGLHRVAWDGMDRNGHPVPAGFYFYKLEAGEDEALKRLRVLGEVSPLPSE